MTLRRIVTALLLCCIWSGGAWRAHAAAPIPTFVDKHYRYSLRYPAGWLRLRSPLLDFAVVAPDHNGALVVAVGPGQVYRTAMSAALTPALARFGTPEGTPTFTPIQVGGAQGLEGQATVRLSNGGSARVIGVLVGRMELNLIYTVLAVVPDAALNSGSVNLAALQSAVTSMRFL